MPRHQLTPEQRAAGGRTRAAQATFAAARSQGGQTRAAQEGFAEHNARIAPLGAQAVLDRYGKPFLVRLIARAMRTRPNRAERWVMRELQALGLRRHTDWFFQPDDFADDPDPRIPDFLIYDRAGVPWLAVEPGAAHWHTAERDTALLAKLAAHGWRVLFLDADLLRTKAGRGQARGQLHAALGVRLEQA